MRAMSSPNKHERTPRSITAADLAAAARLQKLWTAEVARRKERGIRFTQEMMGEIMARELGQGSQSSVSQYLKGKLALNYKAVLLFSQELGCDPTEIRGDLPEQQLAAPMSSLDTDALPQEVSELREDVKALTLALGATLLVLRKFQPVEARDVVQSLRKKASQRALAGRVIPQLLEALDAE